MAYFLKYVDTEQWLKQIEKVNIKVLTSIGYSMACACVNLLAQRFELVAIFILLPSMAGQKAKDPRPNAPMVIKAYI